ncbi:hypothetical protein AB4Z35_01480 [Pseudomonas sp. KB_15]
MNIIVTLIEKALDSDPLNLALCTVLVLSFVLLAAIMRSPK